MDLFTAFVTAVMWLIRLSTIFVVIVSAAFAGLTASFIWELVTGNGGRRY